MSKETRELGSIPGGIELVEYTAQPGLYAPSNRKAYFPYSDKSLGTEVYTPNSEGRRDVMKDFEHYKLEYIPPTTDVHVANPIVGPIGYVLPGYGWLKGIHKDNWYGYDASQFGAPDRPILGLPVMYDSSKERDFIPNPVELSQMEQRALAAIVPTFRAELSSLNTIIELGEIASIRNTVKNIRKLPTRLRGGGRPIRDILRTTGDGHLQYAFNLRPLVADIAGVSSAISRVKRRVNAAMARAAKLRWAHWSVDLTEHEGSTEDGSPYSVDRVGLDYESREPRTFETVGPTFATRFNTGVTSKFHVTIEYRFLYTRFQYENAHWLALQDNLGLNYNPAIIWNAIPWSFVVDWVVGISNKLDNFKAMHMEPQLGIRQYCWSIRRTRRTSVTYSHANNTVGWASGLTVPVGTVVETAYKRRVGRPTTTSLTTSGLSPRELALSASLVITRRRRVTNRR